MNWAKEEAQLKETAAAIAKVLVGKTIASVDMTVCYPGHFGHVEIRTTDGDRLTVGEGMGAGCPECDPEGMGSGVNVDLGVGK
jgi:hypothetical protein